MISDPKGIRINPQVQNAGSHSNTALQDQVLMRLVCLVDPTSWDHASNQQVSGAAGGG